MIYFPDTFTPVPAFPGYFWDTKTEKLFSIKIGGILKELKMKEWNVYAARNSRRSRFIIGEKYYAVSHKGRNRTLKL